MKKQMTLIAGVLGADAHIIGHRILCHALEKRGFKVISLGAYTSQQELIDAAIEENADAIVISSLNGHAEIECEGFADKCKEAGVNVPLYIGGNVVIGPTNWTEVEQKFKNMGFKRCYPPGTLPKTLVKDLQSDFSE